MISIMQSYSHVMLSNFIDLTVLVSSATNAGEEAFYGCVANGYPDIQLVTWQTGYGMNVVDPSQYNVTSEKFEFGSMVTSVLIVERGEVCKESRGYTCIFSMGTSPVVQGARIHCIPGKCVLNY